MGGRERWIALVVFFLGAMLVAFLAAHAGDLVGAVAGVVLILATLVYFRIRLGRPKSGSVGEEHLLDTVTQESAYFRSRHRWDIWH